MKILKKRDWFYLIAGTALMAIGAEGFFEHADLVAGGITGIGMDTGTVRAAYTPLVREHRVERPSFFIGMEAKGKSLYGAQCFDGILVFPDVVCGRIISPV